MNKQETLRHYFGHSEFRPGQEPLIDALLSGRDALGIMPTGAGKSMCYQIPALMLPGITLVISPLISLMKDQVAALKAAGVPAAYLNSSLTASQMELAMSRACQGAYRIIYVAPERLETMSFIRFAQTAQIAMLAVDEAHCVSQWGQDFRPHYLRIADFIDSLPRRPVVGAFTATATDRVKNDIIRLLRLRSPVLSVTGFDRPNLFFEVCQPKSKYEALRVILRQKTGQSGIVYCATRKTVEEVTDKLLVDGFNAGRYHAGLSDEERQRTQEDFRYDRVTVMVATNAFGMGIDKSNVSYVIHYNMPRSMEAYYQEAGRAGRDGSDAECVMLYSGQDIITGRWLIEHSEPNEQLTEDEQRLVRRQDLKRLNDMADYATKATCLRRYILRYFGQNAPEQCGTCSRCVSGHYPQVNGIERKKVTAADRAAVSSMPRAGQSLVQIVKDENSLFAALRTMRGELSRIHHMPAYLICSDKTLTEMSARRPHTTGELLQVYGMGDTKTERFGRDFLKTIADWEAKQRNLESQRNRIRDEKETVVLPGSFRDSGELDHLADAFGCTAAQAGRALLKAGGGVRKPQLPWGEDENRLLRQGYLNGESIRELAQSHGRTEEQVRAQLKKMHMLFDTGSIGGYGLDAYLPEDDR